MPVPARDYSALHLSINPTLVEYHHLYPLSRYVSAVSLLKLVDLARKGNYLVGMLDWPSWITLVCLDDTGADYCISQAAHILKYCPHAPINAMIANLAIPFLVPMMVPVYPGTVPPVMPATTATIPAPAPVAHARTTHVSESTPAKSSTAAQSQASCDTPKAMNSGGGGKVAGIPQGSQLVKVLPSNVQRMVCYLAMELGVDMSVFDGCAEQLQKLSASMACQALREFAKDVRAGNKDHVGCMTRALCKAC